MGAFLKLGRRKLDGIKGICPLVACEKEQKWPLITRGSGFDGCQQYWMEGKAEVGL